MSSRLLVVEDEDSLAVGLVDVLRVKGYTVDREADGVKGLQSALTGDYQLILLDVSLPGLSGFDVLRALRSGGSDIRVIMLTARDSELDRVLGFELGVDDYVTKPFSLLELLGRIGAILRRSAGPAPALRLGDAVLDLERFTLTRDGQPLELPAKGFEVLRVLVENQGRVVSRDALMDQVWGVGDSVTLRTLNNLMAKIRKVLAPEVLKTVHGIGYRLDL